jgi:hypothetical protein
MTRLIGSRTIAIAWVAFHTAVGAPTGTVVSATVPASAGVGTVPLSFHGADPLRRFGFGSPFQHWTGWIVAPVGPPTGTAASAVRCAASATGTVPTPPGRAPKLQRYGFGSRIISWTGCPVSFPVIGGATAASSTHTACGATGKLIFANAPSLTVVRYGKLFSSFGVLKRWVGIVLAQGPTVRSSTRPACAAAGTHTPIPYTGTGASSSHCACFGTNMLWFHGPAAGSTQCCSLSAGGLTFSGRATSSVKSTSPATTAGLAVTGQGASASRCGSRARGFGPGPKQGHMRYIRYRMGPLASKGA